MFAIKNHKQIKKKTVECNIGPCGGQMNGELNAAIMSQMYSFVMEKNLDHYYASMPGNFTINLWTSGGEFIRTLGMVMDDSRPSGSIYQVMAPIPHEGGMSKYVKYIHILSYI